MPEMTPLVGRVLALALLVLVLLAGHGLVLGPLLAEWRANAARIDQARELTLRYHAVAALCPELERRLEQLGAADADAWVYLEGASDALAAAALQDRVRELVAAAGGELRSTQILPAGDDDGLRRIALRVQLAVDAAALQAVLHELETGRPLLFLDNLVLRARQARGRGAVEDDGTIDLALDLYGYLRPEQP
jgi:general secretion pathway protein M